MLKKIMVLLTTVVTAATLFSCGERHHISEEFDVTNCYGETIKCVIYDGQMCDAKWGTPIIYCDYCHGIMNGRGTYGFGEYEGCENCIDELVEAYKIEHGYN